MRPRTGWKRTLFGWKRERADTWVCPYTDYPESIFKNRKVTNMKRRIGLWLATSSFTLLLVACGGGGEQKPAETAESKPAESAAPAGPVTTVDPATAATITGKVSFEGEKPKPRQIRMDAEASCASLHKEQVFAEEVVVNDNKTLQYVFVYVKEGLGDKTFAASNRTGMFWTRRAVFIRRTWWLFKSDRR